MSRIKRYIYIILLVLIAVSCSKDDPGGCFVSNGAITEVTREATPFTYLIMNNNVDVFLSYSPEYSITVRAGENVAPGITTEITGKTLIISNKNTCNWLRSYEKPIEVYLGLPKLDSILYQATGNLTSLNQFVGDSIQLDVLEGAGSINLWIEMQKSRFNLHYGTADLTVKGFSHINYLYSAAYGPAYLSELNTTFTYHTNASTNNCYVRAELELNVNIYNIGDVYYSGNPATINKYITGTGNLYKE